MKKLSLNSNLLKTFLFLSVIVFIPGSCEVADDLTGNKAVDEILGEWSVDEQSEIFGKSTLKSTLDNYNVTISADPDRTNGVIIDNFYNVGISVHATVSGNSITIPNQNAQDGYSVYGSGTVSGNSNEINMDYVVNDGSAQDDHCTAVYSKI